MQPSRETDMYHSCQLDAKQRFHTSYGAGPHRHVHLSVCACSRSTIDTWRSGRREMQPNGAKKPAISSWLDALRTRQGRNRQRRASDRCGGLGDACPGLCQELQNTWTGIPYVKSSRSASSMPRIGRRCLRITERHIPKALIF